MMVLAVRAGVVQTRTSHLGPWRSAIEKHRLSGPVVIHSEGVTGDQQADRKHHGGVDKAILAYSSDHYPTWRDELGVPSIRPGALGENFEVTGQAEPDVCIGDEYRICDVIVQVSQPRQPCWKPAFLNHLPDFTTQIANSGRTGWYLRVLQTGTVEPPCEVTLLERPHPEWTVDRANRLVYHGAEDRRAQLELAALPELAAAWQHMLRKGE